MGSPPLVLTDLSGFFRGHRLLHFAPYGCLWIGVAALDWADILFCSSGLGSTWFKTLSLIALAALHWADSAFVFLGLGLTLFRNPVPWLLTLAALNWADSIFLTVDFLTPFTASQAVPLLLQLASAWWMLLRIWWFCAVFNYQFISQTQESKKASLCEIAGLEDQDWTALPGSTSGAKAAFPAFNPSLQGYSLPSQFSGYRQLYSQQHGANRPMEVPAMQKAVQSNSPSLPSMWEEMAGSRRQKLCAESNTSLGLAGAVCRSIQEAISTCQTGRTWRKSAIRTEELITQKASSGWQRWQKGEGQRSIARRWQQLCFAASTACALASGTGGHYAWIDQSTCELIDDSPCTGCHCGNPPGFPGCITDAWGVEADDRQERSAAEPTGDQRDPQCNVTAREAQEDPTGCLRSPPQTPGCMVQVHSGLHRRLDEALGRFRRTGGIFEGSGDQDQTRDCDLFRNYQSSQQCPSPRDSSPRGGPTHGDTSTAGRNRPQGLTEQSHTGAPSMCCWPCKGQRGGQRISRGYDCVLRGRRKRSDVTIQIKIQVQGSRTASYIVILGSASHRPTSRCLHGPTLVRYNAIEAYGEAGVEQAHCAAGRIDSPFIGSWVHSVVDELDFVSPYHAVLNALCLQLSVAVSPVRDFLRSPYDYDASLCVGSSVTAVGGFNSCIEASTVKAPRVAIKKQRNVSFHNKIEVYLAEDTTTMKFCTSQEALHTYPGKPWSLYGSAEAFRYDISSPNQPSKWRLLDDWIEQTSLPQVLEDGVIAPFQDDDGTPLLIIDEWERLRHILDEEVVSQDGEVQLSMHGLLWVDIGCRFATARPDIPSIRNAVLIAWEDYLRGNLVGHLHIVIPQGRQQVGELQLIVEMRPPLAEPPGGGTPILRRTLKVNLKSWRPTRPQVCPSSLSLHKLGFLNCA